jgi:hypothetical protein
MSCGHTVGRQLPIGKPDKASRDESIEDEDELSRKKNESILPNET